MDPKRIFRPLQKCTKNERILSVFRSHFGRHFSLFVRACVTVRVTLVCSFVTVRRFTPSTCDQKYEVSRTGHLSFVAPQERLLSVVEPSNSRARACVAPLIASYEFRSSSLLTNSHTDLTNCFAFRRSNSRAHAYVAPLITTYEFMHRVGELFFLRILCLRVHTMS